MKNYLNFRAENVHVVLNKALASLLHFFYYILISQSSPFFIFKHFAIYAKHFNDSTIIW